MGDVVRAIPALRHLRATYPEARVDVLAASAARELLDACPYVDRTYDLARRSWMTSEPIDVAISLAEPAGQVRIAVDDVQARCRIAWGGGSDVAVPRDRLRPRWPERLDDTSRMLRLVWLLGGASSAPALGLWPTLADRNGAARLLAGIDRPVAVLHVGASHAARRWPEERWARVVELVDGLGLQVVLVGSRRDQRSADTVLGLVDARVIDLVAQSSVGELAGLLERASLFVGGDSGPAALAAALRVRSVVIGPESRLDHAPRPGQLELIDNGPCATCGERACAHDTTAAAAIPLDAVLTSVTVAAARAVEQWDAARID
jgi:ADP-heptose:LPS heptosyltransferase